MVDSSLFLEKVKEIARNQFKIETARKSRIEKLMVRKRSSLLVVYACLKTDVFLILTEGERAIARRDRNVEEEDQRL